MEASTSSVISVDEELVAPDVYDFIIIDGGVLIHSLPGTTVQGKTFDSYFDKVFCPRVRHDLKRSTRVDIVWDQYRALTIKGGTKEKRGTGIRQRICGTAKIPGNWQNFLANVDKKKELFSFLSKKITEEHFPDDKNVYITAGDQVHHVGNSPPMDQCNHEEADTRVLVHFLHALQSSSLGMVYTGDTDVVVLLLSNFHHIKALNPAAEIWISFKAGKTTRMISLNTIATNLGTTTCKAMALFHAFTGSDSTSSFKFKGKRSCCTLMHEVQSLMEQFATIVDTPFQTLPRLKEVATNFVCRLYSNESNEVNDVDLVRMRLFSQKIRDVERIPQPVMLWINISKGVSSKRASGQQPTGPWCLSATQLTMGGRKRTASCFPFGPRCPSPRMCSTWMWSALAKLPALGANAWRQSWSAHVSASAHARSSWTRTISNTNMYIYYWNKVTVHHLKLCYFLIKKDNTMICGVLLNHYLTVNRIISKSVKLASTPMMDTHDTEFVNWLLTPHLFKDVSRSLVSKHTDFEIILLTVKQWFNRTPQIIVLSFFIKK